MRTARWLTLATMALGIVVGGAVAASAQVPNMKTVMRNKLTDAQALVRPVVNGDFAAIERASARLSRISETEIASWQTPGASAYAEQASRFLTAVQDLRAAARRRDQRAAGEAYGALMSSCASCHAAARQSRIVLFRP